MKSRFLPAVLLLFAISSFQNLNAQTNFTVNINGPTVMCAGQCDTIVADVSNLSPQIQLYFIWTVTGPNGYTSSSTDGKIFFCPPAPGTYTFTLQALASTGVAITDTHTVNVLNYLPLDIISSNTAPCNFDSTTNPDNTFFCEKVCPNSTVTYSVQTSGSPGGPQTVLTWQISGASSYTVHPPFFNSVTVTWGGPGVGSVVVFADGGVNSVCSGEDALCVTIIEEPKAKFTADPAPTVNTVQVCKGQTVYFDNQSTGADSYEWLFGDDLTTSSETHPEHIFLTPGNYTVRLIARSDCLCADTTTLNVEVLDASAPSIDCVGTLCPGETVTYTASNACAPYTWAVTPNGTILNGGTTTTDSITVQWNAGPEGIISLGAQPCSGNVCPFPASIRVPIISDDAEIRGAEQVCPAAVEIYSILPYGGTGFVWTLSGGGTITEGQGTNRVTIAWTEFPSPTTTYWLSVVYDNCYLGCGGQDSIAVRVLSPFIINGPVERCEGANGNFTSKLSSNNQNLSADWTLYAPDGSVAWTSPAASASVSVPFANGPGVYRLLATPNDPTQTCSNQADWAINVAPLPAPPTGILGEINICPNTTYTYEATGTSPTNNLRWTVQNGAGAPAVFVGNKINVTWGNADPRWISVAQVSTNGLNCSSDTALLTVQNIGLVTIIGDQAVCEDATGNYSIAPLQNIDFQWKISPTTAGAVANGQGTNAAEIFWTEPGGHIISVEICGQLADIPVTVIAPPDPMVQHAASLCPGNVSPVQTVTPYTSYSWRNAAGSEIANTPTTNLVSGSYFVQVEDANGCPGTKEFSIGQNPIPNVSITTADPTGFCNNASFVTITALTNADGDFTYQWFQNGSPVGGNTATYTTNQYGSYSVQVTNAAGCSATAGSILLYSYCGGGGGGGGSGQCFPGTNFPLCPPGSVDFSIAATTVCDSFNFQLIPSAQYVPGSAEWTFGTSGGSIDGTSLDENPGFKFLNAGKYIAMVKVFLQDGTECVILDSVSVAASAQFTSAPGCVGEDTDFQDVSTFLPGSSIAAWSWDFGDPGSGAANVSSIRNPSHIYASSGNPFVTLTITADNGCTSSVSQTPTIPAAIPADFSPPPLQCAGNALEFTAITTPDMTQVTWDFGDLSSGPANDATGSPAYHSFALPGNYAITTTATNAYGCTASFTKIITIAPNALSGLISPASPAPICEGTTVTLTAPPGATSYLWSDGTTTTQTFVTGEEGVYSVTLTDASGCTYAPPPVNVSITPSPDALIKALLENELGQIIGTSYPTLNTCEGEDVHLFAQANGSYTYSWSGGNGFDNEVFFTDDRGNLLSVGTHIFTVTVTDATSGCTSVTDPFVVTVNPVPSGFSIASNGACAGSPNVLTYSGPQPANWQFIWNNGTLGTSLTTEDPGFFYIRVINEFGCEAKSDPLNMLSGPNVAAIPGGCHARCSPDTLCLPPIQGIVSWQWFLNGSPIPGATTPDFVATQSGSYYAELTDVFGCTNQSDPLSLNLLDGYGNIEGQVWSDVNNNGMIDVGDTLVPGIAVNLLQNGSPVGTGLSASNGDFSFANILSTNYLVEIDAALLPSNWQVVIGQSAVNLSGCGAFGESDLLLNNCPPSSSVLFVNVCPNEVYDYNGTLLLPGQTQDFILQNFMGCDSVVTVTVFQVNESASSLSVSICPGDVYDFNGTLMSAGQTQDFHLQNQLGCDSTVTVSVSALPVSASTLNVSTCFGTTYDYNGTPLAIGQTQDFVFQNYLGCDSTVTVSVSALPVSASTLDVSTCPGTTYDYNGTPLAIGQTQDFVFQNYLGCDSTVTVSVSALPVSASTLDVSTCPGTTYDYNGTPLAIGQTQDFVFQNYLGCDSTVTVTVDQSPSQYIFLDALVCDGDSLLYDGVWIPANSSHIFNYVNSSGCDSILEIGVGTFGPIETSTLAVSVCPGSTFDYEDNSLIPGQSADFVLQNMFGCDSIVTVTVSALPTSASAFTAKVCPGETFSYQGFELSAGEIEVFNFTNSVGCDSLVTVAVTELPVAAELLEVSACPGTTYDFNGTEIPAGDTAVFHYIGSEGCDSAVTVVVLPFPEVDFAAVPESSCATSPTGSLTVTSATGGLPPYRYSLDGSAFQDSILFENLSVGDYTVYLEDSNGCIFENETSVDAFPRLTLELPDGVLPCDNTGTRLETFASGDLTGLTFKWFNGDTTAFTSVADPGPVWVEATNRCETVRREAAVNWADVPGGTDFLYMPNVIKPASTHPDNSEFKPFFQPNLAIVSYQLEVFDRWGNRLFTTERPDVGWRGDFRADDMNPGVYVWFVKTRILFCGRERDLMFKGDVTVVR